MLVSDHSESYRQNLDLQRAPRPKHPLPLNHLDLNP